MSVDAPFANLLGRVSYARLVDTFRKTSPVSASVWTLPGTAPMSVWSEIAQVAPRLRVLTLNIGPPSRDSSFAQWLVRLPCRRPHLSADIRHAGQPPTNAQLLAADPAEHLAPH